MRIVKNKKQKKTAMRGVDLLPQPDFASNIKPI